jgi:hypothetical protein
MFGLMLSLQSIAQIPPTVSLRGKTFKLSWWDEFSGPRVDSTRWDFRRDSKALSTQLARNNEQTNGILRQFLRKETANGKSFTAGGLISEDTLHYGYYEAMIKTPPKKGWHSGFWLMKQDGTGGTGVARASVEVDILENDSENLNSFTCLHKKYNPVQNLGTKTFNTSQLSQRFVKVGCLYEADSIIFFYDGVRVDKRYCGHLITGKVNIWLTCIGYTSPINESVLPSTFEVDYIRFYELNPPLKAPVTLNPVADAYVQNNGAENTNFGNSTTLLSQNSGSGTQGEAVFRFDLSSVKYYIGSAKLRVFARNQSNNTNPIRVRATGLVNTSIWDEAVINWNNKPSESGVWNDEKTVTGTTGKYYEWDVTSYVKAQKEGNLRNSVGIKLSQMPGYEDLVEMISREGGTNTPQLVLKPAEDVPVFVTQPKDTVWMKDSVLQYSAVVSTVKQSFFQWKKNGIPIPGATTSTLSFSSLQLADSGYYSLAASYGLGFDTVESKIGKISVRSSNQKPTGSFLSPAAGSDYSMGQVITLSGNGTDPETGPLKSPDIRWSYRYFRNGTLINSQQIGSGFSVGFTVPVTTETGSNVYYRIFMVARDPQGGRDTVWRDIVPRVRNVTVQTNPAGYQIMVNGTTQTSPFSVNAIEGSLLPLSVPDPQAGLIFQSWSQGGAQSQNYTVPGTSFIPTANLVSGNITIRNTIADAYVLGSSSTNFGTQNIIGSKFNATTSQVRESFLRFDLTNLPGSLLNAKLRLYGGLSDNTNPSLKVDVRQVNTSGVWEETTVSWSNKPATISTILASNECFGTTKVYYEWDLTSFLQGQLSQGRSTVNLHLSSPDETASRVDFNSREATSFLPELRMALTDGPPVVTKHPSSQTICEGIVASFSSEASAIPNATVKWQVSTNSGGTWSDISGATQASLNITPSFPDNGKWYRAVWTNGLGSVNSNAAILTIRQNPVTSIQASGPVSFCEGGNLTLTALASPNPVVPAPPVVIIADRTSASDQITMLPATGSSTPVNEEVYRAIDNNTGTKYLNLNKYVSPGNGNSGLEIKLGYGPAIITGLSVTSGDTRQRDPKSYSLSGSNDGLTWTAISSGSLAPFTANLQKQTVTFSNPRAFDRYRIIFPTIIFGTGGFQDVLEVREIELLETSLSINAINFSWNTGATTASIPANSTGNYTVTVTDAYNCASQASQNVTVSSNPQVYNVSGGGSYCASPGVGVPVQLSGSEAGVNYQYWFTAGDSVSQLPGTGTALVLDSVKGAGTVYVKARNATSGCETTMNGSASIQVLPNQIWFEDYDGDGFGNPVVFKDTCAQPVGYINIAGDCKDSIATESCYCRPQDMVCTTTNLQTIQVNTLSFSGGCDNATGYKFYPTTGSNTTVMQRGLTYAYSIQTSDAQSGLGIWCDFNEDNDFDDPNEFLFGSAEVSNLFSGNLQIPQEAQTGLKRLRIRTIQGINPTAEDACTYFISGGETKDFTIEINQPEMFISNPIVTEICAGTDVSVAFTTTGTFMAGNTYQVQISTAGGEFGPGTSVIGRGSTSPIACHISLGAIGGTYRLRVVASTPLPGTFGDKTELFVIRPKPASPTSSSFTRCGSGSVTLSGAGCTNMAWYDASSKGNLLGTGTTFTTPTLSANRTYFLACIDAFGCGSFRTPSTAVIYPLPAISGMTPSSGNVNQTTVVLTGVGFAALDSVVFSGGKKATILSTTSTSVQVRVPIGATTGPVRVFTKCGTAQTSGSFTPVVPTVASPIFSSPGGTYPTAQIVALSCNTVGAEIYYTMNGSTPVIGNSTTYLYSGSPITVATSLVIKAMSSFPGWVNSPEVQAAYTISLPSPVATPVISPASGSYTGGQVLTITCSTPQSTIWYTTNGQIPVVGRSSTLRYLGPVTLTAPSVTIRAIAVREGWSQSGVAVSFLTISGAIGLQACTFSPAPGTYGSAQNVTISNPDPLASIYYTLDGTDPYIYFPLAKPYSGPVAITTSRTLRASAFRPGFGDSPRFSGNYIISAGRLAVDPMDQAELSSTSEYSIFPNPFKQRFTVLREKVEGSSRISVFEATGRQVMEVGTEASWKELELDLKDQPAGLYVVHILDESGKRQSLRIMKE